MAKKTKTEKTSEPVKAAPAPVKTAPAMELVPNQPASDETKPNRAPTHEEISRRAYDLWVKRGGVGGDAQDDWFRAEQDLRAGR